jgi:hypothetical protein
MYFNLKNKNPNQYGTITTPEKTYQWYDFLCEYYNVTPEQALQLGTRSSGRKPNLPGSKTCKPVKDMTFEDIWTLQSRFTPEDIFQFYLDQGAWSSFRQTVRHLELQEWHKTVLRAMISRSNIHFCEYGCGIAPYSTTILLTCPKEYNIDITISDVENCEHFLFGQWKLKKIIKDRGLKNVKLHVKPVGIRNLPKFDKPIDSLIVFEVLEHVLSPVETLNNIIQQMSPEALLLENFIKHERDDDDDLGPDLKSAADEREEFYKTVEDNFLLLSNNPVFADPDGTRIWRKLVKE